MLELETADDLLDDLDDSQRRAVMSPAKPLAILAPAGSGKTRVLTRRIAWRVATEDAEAPHVLALTFTRKAAGEMQSRLARLGLRGGVATGTFHGIAYAQLRALWTDRRRPLPALVSRKGDLLRQALEQSQAEGGRSSSSGAASDRALTPSALANEIEWAKARLFGPDDYAHGATEARRRRPVAAERVAKAYAAYEQIKRRSNLADFDDLLKLCSDALLNDTAFAAAQRWRFRHLFVDEFQDINPLQLRLLDAWRGSHYDLCVVGDPQQAIYGWNGADPELLRKFRTLYPPAEVIELERNYRSTPQVLAAANQVLRAARAQPGTAQAMQGEGPAPRVTSHPTDLDEATAVARAVRDKRAPRTAWSAQAVLVRTHGQIGLLTEALRAARIPYRVRGAESILDDRQVQKALRLLRGSDRLLSTCLPDLDALAAEALDHRTTADNPTLEEGDGTRPASHRGTAGSPLPLTTLIELARDHHRIDPRSSAAGFAAWAVATLQAEGADGTEDAVTVATFHAAKGLEWPVVHLAGLEDGFVPIMHARTAAARAEEVRLLYVAMTRAVRELSCTWARQRSFNGKTVDRKVCPWVRELGATARRAASAATSRAAGGAGTGRQQAEDWKRNLAEQRKVLAAARSQPAPVVSRLRAWRERTARVARVEPTAVMDDRLLEAVADAMPTDREELAAVPGMGRLVTARLGDSLLEALNEARSR